MDKQTIVSQKDLDISYFCGPGPGGQKRNKTASGVQIVHRESGATGRASDSRSQFENRCNAFKRMTEQPKFKFWLAKKKFELVNERTIEEQVEKELEPSNLKFEIKEDGKWKEVDADHFESEIARQENK